MNIAVTAMIRSQRVLAKRNEENYLKTAFESYLNKSINSNLLTSNSKLTVCLGIILFVTFVLVKRT